MAEPSVTTETYEPLRPLAFSIAYRMLGSVAEAEDVVQEALLRLHRADARRAPEGVRGHGRDAPGDRRAALRPRAPRDLRRPVAAGADRHRLAARRRVGLDGAAGHAREPHPGRARGLPAARRLRLRLRRDRRDRRQDAARTAASSRSGPAATSRPGARASSPRASSARRSPPASSTPIREGDLDGLVDAARRGRGRRPATAAARPRRARPRCTAARRSRASCSA